MQFHPNHHTEDIGARFGDPSSFKLLGRTTEVPK
jgi:hypothetical protein